MCQRQVEEHDVAVERETLDLLDARGHHVVVAVADHAGLRRARRARGVDVRVEVVLADRGGGLVERTRVLARVRDPLGPQCVEVGDREHVVEAQWLHFFSLLLVLDKRPDGFRVLEHIRGLALRAVGVDRCRDPAHEREREVEERPFEPRPAEDSERVPAADPPGEKSVCDLIDTSSRLHP